MTPAETMAHRRAFVDKLHQIDHDLALLLSNPPSNRIVADVRAQLAIRRAVCDELKLAGFHPWPVKVDERESKVS